MLFISFILYMYFLLNYLIIYMTKVQAHANNYRQRSPSQVCGNRIYCLLVSALIAFVSHDTHAHNYLSLPPFGRAPTGHILTTYLLPIPPSFFNHSDIRPGRTDFLFLCGLWLSCVVLGCVAGYLKGMHKIVGYLKGFLST